MSASVKFVTASEKMKVIVVVAPGLLLGRLEAAEVKLSVGGVVSVGASLVPVMVMATVWVSVPVWPSLALTV